MEVNGTIWIAFSTFLHPFFYFFFLHSVINCHGMYAMAKKKGAERETNTQSNKLNSISYLYLCICVCLRRGARVLSKWNGNSIRAGELHFFFFLKSHSTAIETEHWKELKAMRASINATFDRKAIRMLCCVVHSKISWTKRHNGKGGIENHMHIIILWLTQCIRCIRLYGKQPGQQPNRIGFYLYFSCGLCSCLATSPHTIYTYITYVVCKSMYRERVLNAEIKNCYHAAHLLLLVLPCIKYVASWYICLWILHSR